MELNENYFFPLHRQIQIKGFYSFFDKMLDSNFYFAGEYHDFWEVVYCLDGTIGVSADENIYTLNPGDIIIHKPNEFHKIWSEGESPNHVMIFSFAAIGNLLDRLGGAYSCNQELQLHFQAIYRRIKETCKFDEFAGYMHYLRQHPQQYNELANLCENALILVSSSGLALGYNQSKNAIDYKKVVTTMQQNLSKSLSVDELSGLCGLSVSSMKNLFKMFNSKGIHEYFLWLKMTEAMQMLQAGKTVTEVSEELGFTNQSYFSTSFKRVMGESPAKYKTGKHSS